MASQDKPRHIEMGSFRYQASPAEVSIDVRSLLEEHGRPENFYLASTSEGNRVKATAWFGHEADATSACTLDRRTLPILKGGKLTVTLIQSAKIKISMAEYFASKNKIDQARKIWSEQHLAFHVYMDASRRFCTLKVEGDSAKYVASARKVLNEISTGLPLADGENAIWSPALINNGSAFQKLKSIEHELQVRIFRDKSKCQRQFFGPLEKLQQAVYRVQNMLRAESSTCYEIDLKPHQFHRMIQGWFKHVDAVLGKDVAIFNGVLRKIIINGTVHEYDIALAIIDGNRALEGGQPFNESSVVGTDCPICFCEVETPVRTSCEHTYCLDCFQEYCKSAASTSIDQFRIKCQGDGGNCTRIFSLRELKDHLSSLAFEEVLESSFEEYIQRHTEAFRYCKS